MRKYNLPLENDMALHLKDLNSTYRYFKMVLEKIKMSKVYKWTDMQTETDDGQLELSAQVSEKSHLLENDVQCTCKKSPSAS